MRRFIEGHVIAYGLNARGDQPSADCVPRGVGAECLASYWLAGPSGGPRRGACGRCDGARKGFLSCFVTCLPGPDWRRMRGLARPIDAPADSRSSAAHRVPVCELRSIAHGLATACDGWFPQLAGSASM